MQVTLALAGHMLVLGGIAKDMPDAMTQVDRVIANGSALEKFRQMCKAQGGDPNVADDYSLLPTAATIADIAAPEGASGYVCEVDALRCGQAILALGGGRRSVTDTVDHSVGISNLIKVGDIVATTSRLCTLHSNDSFKADRAETLIREAIKFSPTKPQIEPLLQDLID